MKYIVIEEHKHDQFRSEFNNLWEAIAYADEVWDLLTDYDKTHIYQFFVMESENEDEEAPNHLDGDLIKLYSSDKEVLFEEDGIVLYALNGVIYADSDHERVTYPDTEENRISAIADAKATAENRRNEY